jgi:diketogulonate reductase-like aldo/keto reductase
MTARVLQNFLIDPSLSHLLATTSSSCHNNIINIDWPGPATHRSETMLAFPLIALVLLKQLALGMADEALAPVPRFTLSNNITIPLVGLGSASGVGYLHVSSAIKAGYRFIDTAQSSSWGYKENEVGNAVADAKMRYEDMKNGDANEYVFVQTKIHPQDLGYKATKAAIELSLSRMRVTSLDSVLLHKPRCWEGVCAKQPEGTWEDSWKALEEAYDAGLVRSIGICDVDNHLLDRLLSKRIKPTIIQNWFDPFNQDKKLRERIASINRQQEEKGLVEGKILYQGYSTMGTQWKMRGYETSPIFDNYVLKNIAKKYNVTIPQILINWATRQGVMVLPASTNSTHQAANLNSFNFALTDYEMEDINALDGHPPGKRKQRSFDNNNEEGVPKDTDPNKVSVFFINQVGNSNVNVYWVEKGGTNPDKHHLMGEMKRFREQVSLDSFHGHEFVFKDAEGKLIHKVSIDRDEGKRQYFEITDKSGEL